jgi:phage-related protein
LHAFQKKSKHGIATSKQDIDLVKRRLQKAQEDYLQEINQRNEENNE